MAHRNRWFTVLKHGWIFHGYVSRNQTVPTGLGCGGAPVPCGPSGAGNAQGMEDDEAGVAMG